MSKQVKLIYYDVLEAANANQTIFHSLYVSPRDIIKFVERFLWLCKTKQNTLFNT
jgi:hypothetical protein